MAKDIPRSAGPLQARQRTHQQNALRERLKAGQHIIHIEKTAEKLRKFGMNNEANNPTHVDHVSKDQRDALKMFMDSQFKMLAKVLPDLKATEITVSGEITHKALNELSNEDLEKIISGDTKTIEGECEEIQED